MSFPNADIPSMRTCGCLLVLCFVTVSIIDALPQRTLTRTKRGFRQGIVMRIGHGFGKRGDNLFEDFERGTEEENDSQVLMRVEELAEQLTEHPEIAEALIRKFVDTNGDGVVTTGELLGKPEV
ncbi:allatotropins-like [Ylistrum balloti]|uniref:allatotropins-like n=1 Tax=Ylistrum balloti TaxID=509963 RepID=UPI0029058953|nr:allatotropins-like [Ylistrum balloti]